VSGFHELTAAVELITTAGQWFLVFVAYVGLDYVFARYTRAAAEGRQVPASNWAVLITLFNAFVVISFVKDPWLILPSCAGAFVGTYLSLRKKA